MTPVTYTSPHNYYFQETASSYIQGDPLYSFSNCNTTTGSPELTKINYINPTTAGTSLPFPFFVLCVGGLLYRAFSIYVIYRAINSRIHVTCARQKCRMRFDLASALLGPLQIFGALRMILSALLDFWSLAYFGAFLEHCVSS